MKVYLVKEYFYIGDFPCDHTFKTCYSKQEAESLLKRLQDHPRGVGRELVIEEWENGENK